MKNSTIFWTIVSIVTLIKLILWRISLNCTFGPLQNLEGAKKCDSLGAFLFDLVIVIILFFAFLMFILSLGEIVRFINNILDNKLKFQIKIRVLKNENKSS